jgi:hypothetical protein
MKPDEIKYIYDNAGRKSAKRIAEELGIKERKVKRLLAQRKFKIEEKPSPEPRQPVTSANKGLTIFSVILIVLIGFVIYANSLGGSFILDDESLVKENYYIRNLSNVGNAFTADIGKGAGRQSNF